MHGKYAKRSADVLVCRKMFAQLCIKELWKYIYYLDSCDISDNSDSSDSSDSCDIIDNSDSSDGRQTKTLLQFL